VAVELARMTYASADASTQDGQPVELYKISVDRTGGGGSGAGGGGTVSEITLEDWNYNGSDINDLLASWPFSAVAAGGSSSFGSDGTFSITTFYSGSLGGGQGHVYHYHEWFTPGPAGEIGQVSMPLTLSRNPSPFAAGWAIDQGPGYVIDDLSSTTPLSLTLTEDVTLPVSTEIGVRLGHFDLEFGEPTITLTFGPITYTRLGAAPDTPGDGDAPVTYHYTSADVPVSFEGNEYLPAILTRTELTSGGRETGDGDVDLTLARDHVIARCFHYGTPQLPVALTLYALHRDNLTADGDGTYTVTDEAEVRTLLEGAMGTRPRFRGNACTLAFAPAETLVDRTVPRYTCSRACPWLLYDVHTCKVNRATFALTGVTVDAVSGRVVTVPGLAAWAGSDAFKAKHGVLIPPSGAQETITDTDLTAETVTLLNVIPGLAPGDVVDILAGCDQLIGTCRTRFDNVANFGGWPDMPVRNPWTGGGLS
jgi:hypothetical protein